MERRLGDITHVWELDSGADVVEVLVPFLDPGLVCGQVRTHKAHGGGVEKEADGHTPLIPHLPRHSCLHRTHGHVPSRERKSHVTVSYHIGTATDPAHLM